MFVTSGHGAVLILRVDTFAGRRSGPDLCTRCAGKNWLAGRRHLTEFLPSRDTITTASPVRPRQE